MLQHTTTALSTSYHLVSSGLSVGASAAVRRGRKGVTQRRLLWCLTGGGRCLGDAVLLRERIRAGLFGRKIPTGSLPTQLQYNLTLLTAPLISMEVAPTGSYTSAS